MQSCLFTFYFKKGYFMVKVNSSSNNLYVEKKDNGEICVFGNEINYLLEFPTNFSAKDFDLSVSKQENFRFYKRKMNCFFLKF